MIGTGDDSNFFSMMVEDEKEWKGKDEVFDRQEFIDDQLSQLKNKDNFYRTKTMKKIS
jgi:hypothetical protein